MAQFSAHIRRQHDWWNHLHNPFIRNSWFEEAANSQWIVQSSSRNYPIQLSDKQVHEPVRFMLPFTTVELQIEYVLNELTGYAALRDEENKWHAFLGDVSLPGLKSRISQVSCFERIWEAGTLLDDMSSELLVREIDMLSEEKMSTTLRSTGKLMIFPVDPYLFPFICNRTLVTSREDLATRAACSSVQYGTSTQYSLLPTDIYISSRHEAKFLSYINDLHPVKHSSAYLLLGKLLCNFIPLFEHTLTDLHLNNPSGLRIPGSYQYADWDEPDTPDDSDDEDGWAYYAEEMRSWELHRPIRYPDVPETGYPGKLEDRNHRVSLSGRKLQVIVKISDLRLEPGSQTLTNSPWQVQGMRNEHIVACGLHCLLIKNIVPYKVRFRMPVAFPVGPCPGHSSGIEQTWGLRSGDPAHQNLGYVVVHPGASLVFPNIYQHSLSEISLADPSRAGRVVVIYFCLVDPDIDTILSTSSVAPQQMEWIRDAVMDVLLPRLPVELIEKIMEDVDNLLDDMAAENYRIRMLEERAQFRRIHNSDHFCIPFQETT
ncbi:hypothetical protein AX17_000605 [Amanita inopinata Kibby_2008]|nr:hypothetical protein AX17_000605 [Amanita inopinata Kibby_2008]